MPSFIGSPLQLVLSGQQPEFDPRFFGGDALPLVLSFPATKIGPGVPSLSSVTTPKLDRLQRQMQYFYPDGTPTVQMQLIWQRTMEAIEGAFLALTNQVLDLEVLIAQIQATNDLAQAAVEQATQTQANVAITGSYTDPVNILRADSDGLIYIDAHTRVYGDGLSVPVNSGSLIGFNPGDYVSVYYEDAARTGGAVNYMATVGVVPQTGATHSVGQILIPAPGEVPNTGGGVSPPGYTPFRPQNSMDDQ